MVAMNSLRLIIHGKASDAPELRDAVEELRERGHDVSVRITWEAGDAERYAREANHDGIAVVVAGGGDGLLNEVVNGVMSGEAQQRSAVAVLPLGSANDFATSIGIPEDPVEALEIAANAPAVPIDVAKANDRFYINVASGGFGAYVTTATPDVLKRVLGGAAYTLMGFANVVRGPETNHVRIECADWSVDETLVMLAVANGRLSGGGFEVAPEAHIDDGLLDATFVREFPLSEAAAVALELKEPGAGDNHFVFSVRSAWLNLKLIAGDIEFINLDGEPSPAASQFRFEAWPRALRFVLPEAASPLLSASRAHTTADSGDE